VKEKQLRESKRSVTSLFVVQETPPTLFVGKRWQV
jgi:hypothetical protein